MVKNNALHISLICLIGLAIGAFVLFKTNISVKRSQIDCAKAMKDISKINEDINGLTSSISHLHKIINNKGIGSEMCAIQQSQTNVNESSEGLCVLKSAAHKNKEVVPTHPPANNTTADTDFVDIDDIIQEVENSVANEDSESKHIEDLSYEEARDLCKKHGLSSKGKKEQLIERLKNI